MATTIESLELQIQQNSNSAVSGINALSKSLSKLRTAVGSGLGLSSMTTEVRSFSGALNSLAWSDVQKIERLADSLTKLKAVGKVTISSSIGNQIRNIAVATAGLTNVDGIRQLADALRPLSTISAPTGFLSTIKELSKVPQMAEGLNNVQWGYLILNFQTLALAFKELNGIGDMSGLTSAISQLSKIPKIANSLKTVDWDAFTDGMKKLSTSLASLPTNINTTVSGFSKLPSVIKQTANETKKLSQSNLASAYSFKAMSMKLKSVLSLAQRLGKVFGGFINESNKYVEDLNLFTVAMGKYASEAKAYAEQVSEVMGIDPADWMRNQGVFNTIIKGFGVVEDKAYKMSKNLTQLGYDISSFYNISIEDAMTKIQSGISGELEPLRRLGYDLSVARLQQEALSLGITKSVTAMNQAEKSQLRYYAIMTQVTSAQGDMARTLNAPANQLRILQAQLKQCARAIGNIFIPMLNAVLPYLIAIAKFIRQIADEIARFFNFKLPEVDYSNVKDTVSSVSDAVADIGNNSGTAKKQVEKLKKSIMGFDELNLLNGKDDPLNSISDAIDAVNDATGDLGIELPEYNFLEGLVNKQNEDIVQKIKGILWELMGIISAFYLVIGTILVLTGFDLKTGLAMIVLGAVGLATTLGINWNSMSTELAKVLSTIMMMLGGFFLALGVILLITGYKPLLGLALMVAGLASIGIGGYLNWKYIPDNIKTVLAAIVAVIGGALLAIGAVLTFTGFSPVKGILLMIAGLTMVASGGALMWDKMPEGIRKVLTVILGIVGGALLVIGAVFTFTGMNPMLGIPLMIAGATALGTALNINWNYIGDKLKSVFSGIGKLFKGVALIAIGLLLVCSVVAAPWGIGLIKKGAASITDALQHDFGEIGKIIGKSLSIAGKLIKGIAKIVIGIILMGSALCFPLGLGMVRDGAKDITDTVKHDVTALMKQVKEALDKATPLVKGLAKVAIGVLLLGVPGARNVGIAMIKEGASASISRAFGIDVKQLESIGEECVNGISSGVSKGKSGFLSKWSDLIGTMVKYIKKVLGINSPSIVFYNIATMVVQGFSNGAGGFAKVFTSIFQSIANWVSTFAKNMYKWGSDIIGNMVSGISKGTQKLVETVSGVASKIAAYLHFSEPDIGPLSDFNSWMPDMMSQLAEGIRKDEYKVRREIDRLASDMNVETAIQANLSAYARSNQPAARQDESNVYSAVYNAVSAAIKSAGEDEDANTPIIINLGNEQIASFLVKQNKRVALISGGRA